MTGGTFSRRTSPISSATGSTVGDEHTGSMCGLATARWRRGALARGEGRSDGGFRVGAGGRVDGAVADLHEPPPPRLLEFIDHPLEPRFLVAIVTVDIHVGTLAPSRRRAVPN